jgi:phosphoesterase RecJ-like protein
MTNADVVQQILSTLKSGQTFCLSGHQNPDADVVGSQLAMASLIERLGPGKKIDIVNFGAPPANLSFLPGYNSIRNSDRVEGHYDVVIVFECSGQDRMGNLIDLKTQAKTVINIDHHLHNPNFGHLNFVEPDTSSTAELIFKIYSQSKLPISRGEAMSMFAGLVADTGWFRYGNTNVQSLSIAGQLLAAGVPTADMAERLYMSRSETSMKLLGWCLTNMKVIHGGRVAVLSLPSKIFLDLHATSDDLEEIVNHGLKVDSVQASVFLREKKDSPDVKVSLRSKGNLDINQVARVFDGGGHKNASGCTVTGSLADVESRVLTELFHVLPS